MGDCVVVGGVGAEYNWYNINFDEMKTITTLTIVLCSIVTWGQTKLTKADSDTIFRIRNGLSSADTSIHFKPLNTYTATYKMVYSGDLRVKYKPIDTARCLMYLYSKDLTLQGWQNGYVVLIDGGVFTDNIEWKKPYFHIAVGPFKNVFLGPNKKEVIKDDYVLQLTLIDY